MEMRCKIVMMVSMVVLGVGFANGEEAEGQVHHVVGGDRGWAPNSDLGSWSSTRLFRVGDHMWFTYSAAEDSIMELKSKEEYELCDTSNPIRMYTDGVNTVDLDREGSRYFASSKPENCKNGLKLHVEVMPKSAEQSQTMKGQALAAGPTAPSGSVGFTGMSFLVLFGLALVAFVG